MTIEIRDAAIEARLQKQMQATGSASTEEALGHLLDTQQELDRWLLENRDFVNAKLLRGIEQLDRGEGIPGDVAKERIQQRKPAWLEQNRATNHERLRAFA